MTYRVVEVVGPVRATDTDADPLRNEGWREVHKGDVLNASTTLCVSLRGEIKLVKVGADPPTLLLLDRGCMDKISDLIDHAEHRQPSKVKYEYGTFSASDRRMMEIRMPPAAPYEIEDRFPTECPLHRTRMETVLVPVQRGMILFSFEDMANQIVRARSFPQSNISYESGGCMDRHAQARVRYCRRCRDAELEWIREHTHVGIGQPTASSQPEP